MAGALRIRLPADRHAAARRPAMIHQAEFTRVQAVVQLRFGAVDPLTVEPCPIAAQKVDAPESPLLPKERAVQKRHLTAAKPERAVAMAANEREPGMEPMFFLEIRSAENVQDRERDLCTAAGDE